jgi:hypothetical protein
MVWFLCDKMTRADEVNISGNVNATPRKCNFLPTIYNANNISNTMHNFKKTTSQFIENWIFIQENNFYHG